jgi:hypothetical protein
VSPFEIVCHAVAPIRAGFRLVQRTLHEIGISCNGTKKTKA